MNDEIASLPYSGPHPDHDEKAPSSHLLELCGKVGDDGVRQAA